MSGPAGLDPPSLSLGAQHAQRLPHGTFTRSFSPRALPRAGNRIIQHQSQTFKLLASSSLILTCGVACAEHPVHSTQVFRASTWIS